MLKKLILPRVIFQSPHGTADIMLQLNGRARLELELLGLLPAEALVGTEVTELGSLVVDGLGQVELLDNDTGSHVEVGTDNVNELLGALLRSAVAIDVDGARLSDTDGVGQLDQSAAAELGVDEGLGDPSGEVGSGAVDLGEVLSGESTTTVGTPTTVGVDDDLAAGQTGVTLGTTNDEETRGLDLRKLLARCLGANEARGHRSGSFDLRGRRSSRRGTERG